MMMKSETDPSYLSRFNYQFYTGSGQSFSLEQAQERLKTPGLVQRKWVFLHGLMGYSLNWRKIVSGLEPTDLALIYDQRGHGKSWKPATGYAPEDYAEDLYLILQELEWDKIELVGHSMGGRNALLFADRFAEKINHLIIEDIGPESQERATEYYEKLMAAVPTPFPNKKSAKEFFLNEFPKNKWIRGELETIGLYLYSNLVDLPDGTADWRFSKSGILESVALGRAKDHWREFSLLSVPCLVLRGAQSPDLSPEVYQRMIASNPRVVGRQIDNAGHWIHYDQPEEFIRTIKSFVAGTLL